MTLYELENAIAALNREDFSKLRDWIIEFENQSWDRQIEDDVRAGRLDALAEQALQDLREGRTTEL